MGGGFTLSIWTKATNSLPFAGPSRAGDPSTTPARDNGEPVHCSPPIPRRQRVLVRSTPRLTERCYLPDRFPSTAPVVDRPSGGWQARRPVSTTGAAPTGTAPKPDRECQSPPVKGSRLRPPPSAALDRLPQLLLASAPIQTGDPGPVSASRVGASGPAAYSFVQVPQNAESKPLSFGEMVTMADTVVRSPVIVSSYVPPKPESRFQMQVCPPLFL